LRKYIVLEEKLKIFMENKDIFIKEYKEENLKIENNIKALWNSFTLFSTNN
jgi:hypothetical protein